MCGRSWTARATTVIPIAHSGRGTPPSRRRRGSLPMMWRKGGDHLNFSEWGPYTVKRQAAKLEMISAEVDKGDMPLKGYLLLHGDAALSEADKDRLCEWASATEDSLMGRTE